MGHPNKITTRKNINDEGNGVRMPKREGGGSEGGREGGKGEGREGGREGRREGGRGSVKKFMLPQTMLQPLTQ